MSVAMDVSSSLSNLIKYNPDILVNDALEEYGSEQPTFVVGDTVQVASRTWPGINQPGGVGRITGISSTHPITECIRVSVRYILDGRHEKEIEIKWVKPYSVDINRPACSRNSLRDRSMLLGRCQRCGSLRKDCGSCDFSFITNDQVQTINRSRVRRCSDESHPSSLTDAPSLDRLDEFNNYSDDSSYDSVEAIMKTDNRRFLRLKVWKAKLRKICNDEHNRHKHKESKASTSHNKFSTELPGNKQNQSKEEFCDSEPIDSEDSSSDIDEDLLELIKADFSQSYFSNLVPNHNVLTNHERDDETRLSYEISECSSPGSPDFADDDDDYYLIQHIGNGRESEGENCSKTQAMIDTFIQPEGNAKRLPVDIIDQTKALRYDELGKFFDDTADKLEKDCIPSAKLRIHLLEKDLRNVGNGSNSNSAKSIISLAEVETKSQDLHGLLVDTLVRNGTDQCEMALKKLGSRSSYQKFKEVMQAKGLPTQTRNLSLRGFRLENIKTISEGLLKHIRSLISRVRFQYDVYNDDNYHSSSSFEADSEELNSAQDKIYESELSEIDVNRSHELLDRPLDPHPHANKKRRRSSSVGKSRLSESFRSRPGCESKRVYASNVEKDLDRAQDFRGTVHSAYDNVETTKRYQSNLKRERRNQLRRKKDSGNKFMDARSQQQKCHGTQPKRDRVFLSSEMERFLDANVEKYFNRKSFRPNDRRSQKKNTDIQLAQTTIDRMTSDEVNRTPVASVSVSFPEDHHTDPYIHDDDWDVAFLCTKLLERFPKQSSIPILQAICLMLKASESKAQEHAKLVFNTFLRLLRDQGCRVLQDYLTCSRPFFSSQSALLTSILDLMSAKCNSFLEPWDESFAVFSPNHCSEFVNFIYLQVVDTVMSVVHPRAWSLQLENTNEVLRELSSLRDVMGNFFLLLERVSQCVTRDLGCQEWRCVQGEHVFVSAVNPKDWENFLSAGIKPPKITRSRYQTFEKLPLCETIALWQLIDFFAQAPPLNNQSTASDRWNLASRLAIEHTLSPSDVQPLLPLCDEQISTVLEDAARLKMLFLSGKMRNLPTKDSTLFSVIQRLIDFELYNIRHNEVYREKCYPSIKAENAQKAHLRNIWKNDNEHKILVVDSCPLEQFAICSGNPEGDTLWMEQPLCLPNSKLLQRALGLLAAWKSQLLRQESQTRCKRFEVALKALIDSLLRQTNTNSQTEKLQDDVDPFSAAFRSNFRYPKCGDPGNRCDLFLIECAVYTMSVIGCLPQQSGINLSMLFEQAWSVLADGAMKNRQVDFSRATSSIPPDRILFQGDPYRLHVTGRYLTLLALKCMGLHVCHGDFVSHYVTLKPTESMVFDEGSFPLLLSSLMACLDCSFDSSHNMEIVASIAGCIAIVFKNYCHVLSFVPTKQTALFKNAFSKTLLSKFFQSMKRGLEIVINVSFCGAEEHLCFQSLLCSIRWALRAVITTNQIDKANTPAATSIPTISKISNFEPSEDNEFDDVDDSFFATIDLTHIIGSQEDVIPHGCEHILEIYALLEDFLQLGRPSVTFLLVEHGARVISVPGKVMISKYSSLICCCLTQLVAARFCPPVESINLLSLPRNWSIEADKRDIHFQRQNCIFLLRELCANEGNGLVDQLISQKQGDVTYVLLEALLRLDSCRKLPSRDIDFFRRTCSETVANEALTKVLDFASSEKSGKSGKLLKLNVATIGRVLIGTAEKDWLCAWKVDSDLPSPWKVRLQPSVEQECFLTFSYVRSLLLLSKKSRDSQFFIAYEEFLLSVVSVMARNLVDLYDAIHNQKRDHFLDCSAGEDKSYSQAFNMLLFHIFSEMLTNLLAWCFRTQEDFSDSKIKFFQWIWNHFVSPLLRQEDFELRDSLFLLGCYPQRPLAPQQANKSTKSVLLRKIMQESLGRRMQGFFFFFLNDSNYRVNDPNVLGSEAIKYSFLNEFFSYVLRSEEPVRYLLLPLLSLNVSESDINDVRQRLGLIQLELFDYMNLVEKRYEMNQHQSMAVCQLTTVAYKDIVVPWIFQPNLVSDKKNRLIQVLEEVLRIDVENANHSSTGVPMMDLHVLCCLCKGIVVSLKSGFVANHQVQEDRIGAVFSCFCSLIQIPASRIQENTNGNLLDWCYTVFAKNDIDFGSSYDIYGNYVWYLSSWLRGLGRFIMDHSLEEMETFRNQLRNNKSCNEAIIWQIAVPRQDSEVTSKLLEFESKVFPKSNYPIVMTKNTYSAKSVSIESVDSLVPWTPSRSVLKKVMKFVTTAAITNQCQGIAKTIGT